MDRELEEKLFAIEPSFFVRTDMTQSAMYFGFEVGNGWYPLIESLIRTAKWKKDHPDLVDNPDYDPNKPYDIETNRRKILPQNCLKGCPWKATHEQWVAHPDRIKITYLKDGKVKDYPEQLTEKIKISLETLDDGTTLEYHHKCERPWNHFRVTQVKEKFGGLRFYVDGADSEYYAKIDFAETLSFKLCEECGSWEGRLMDDHGWVRTTCPKHDKPESVPSER